MNKQEIPVQNISRRKFLGASAATAGIGIASGVSLINIANAKPLDKPVSNNQRWGMLIDANKCASGCTSCVDACNTENGLNAGDEQLSRQGQKAQWIRKVELRDKATQHEISLPLLCQHCENPPCVDVCPTGASFKREDGLVLVDKHTCIGCRYCMMACPYKARSFIHEELLNQLEDVPRGKGTVESCTFCVHRLDEDTDNRRDPACVEACNADGHQAIIFGDMKDANSVISQQLKKHTSKAIRADLKLNPGVRYRGI